MILSDDNERVARDEDLRAQALASSIALFLGDMSLAELEKIDAFVMDVRRDRQTWARHSADTKFHLIVDQSNGSIRTRCRGAWPIEDSYDVETNPARADRCGGCEPSPVDSRLRAALIELRDSPDLGAQP